MIRMHSLTSSRSHSSIPADAMALQRTWRYFVQENHLPTATQGLLKFAGLLFVSGGSALYGVIAQKATEDQPLWIQWSSILGTSICAGIVLINSTNIFFLERNARRLPPELHDLSEDASCTKYFLEDLAVVSVSALSSVSLATTAWNYPKLSSLPLRITWVGYIETVNTILHFWPVGLFIFGHKFYGLPLKFFQIVYLGISNCLVSDEEKEQRELIKLKRTVANELCAKIGENLDKIIAQFIQEDFKWNGFTSQTRQFLSYVKHERAQIDSVCSQEFSDIFPIEEFKIITEQKPHSNWKQSLGRRLKQSSYVGGAAWGVLCCIGYLVDPIYTLQELGTPQNIAISASLPSLYFLGVLLAHTVGLNLEADVTYVGKVLNGQGVMPLAVKLHTKSFALGLLCNIYVTIFSPVGAMQVVRDHFTGSLFERFFIECARTGIMYTSTASLKNFYSEYLIKFVRLSSSDENQLVAQAVERIDAFKRHLLAIGSDHLISSLSEYPDEKLRAILGMSKQEFQYKTDFNARLTEQILRHKESKGCCRNLRIFQEKSKEITPLLSPINDPESQSFNT